MTLDARMQQLRPFTCALWKSPQKRYTRRPHGQDSRLESFRDRRRTKTKVILLQVVYSKVIFRFCALDRTAARAKLPGIGFFRARSSANTSRLRNGLTSKKGSSLQLRPAAFLLAPFGTKKLPIISTRELNVRPIKKGLYTLCSGLYFPPGVVEGMELPS